MNTLVAVCIVLSLATTTAGQQPQPAKQQQAGQTKPQPATQSSAVPQTTHGQQAGEVRQPDKAPPTAPPKESWDWELSDYIDTATLIVTGVFLWFTILTWREMQRANNHAEKTYQESAKETQESLALTRDELEQTRRYTEAAIKSAEAANTSAETAKRALEITESAEVMAVRTYLSDGAFPTPNELIFLTHEAIITIEFKNFGRTRANEVTSRATVSLGGARDDRTSFKGSPTALAAGDTYRLHCNPIALAFPIDPSVIDQINEGGVPLRLNVVSDYVDVFGRKHHFEDDAVYMPGFGFRGLTSKAEESHETDDGTT